MTAAERALKWKIIWAFAAVYVLWGSTYLGIRFALETIPPFTMAAVRFIVAGVIMYVWSRQKGHAIPSRSNWAWALLVGTLLLAGGNGLLVYAEQTVPSSLAALIITTVPLWMVILDWARPNGRRPRASVVLGLIGGLLGVAFLINPDGGPHTGTVPLAGGIVLLIASLSWATGSVVARSADLHPAPLMNVATQMITGGMVLLVASIALGEPAQVDVAGLSLRSLLALLYLILFGAIIGYTAYIWLLQTVDIAKVSTYAYVNPVVAVLLGWGLGGEALSNRTLVAAAIIVASVGLITSTRVPAGARGQPKTAVPKKTRSAA